MTAKLQDVIATGQHWISRDSRDGRRKVEVERISGGGQQMIGSRGQTARIRNVETGRRTAIKLETLRAKYRLASYQPVQPVPSRTRSREEVQAEIARLDAIGLSRATGGKAGALGRAVRVEALKWAIGEESAFDWDDRGTAPSAPPTDQPVSWGCVL